MQILFRRNAAAQQAGAAKIFVALNNGGFQSNLRRANGGGITTRPGSNNGYVKSFSHNCFEFFFLSETQPGSRKAAQARLR
jgi:hypothetical protein